MPEPELSRRAYAIAERAFQEPEASRRAFVENACAGDEELRSAVEDLLAQDAAASSFLEEPLIQGWEEAAEQAWIGRHVGPYRLLRLLGAGGSSRVYLGAREEGELLHQVAVKLLRSSILEPDGARRFETERKVLASLDHPGIARFIDAGTTEEGVPYLVMEYVAGSSITAYCDERRLTVRQRLRLYLEVCRAVQSAHRHLVIHRDIKPSNVLVTADGMPRLLDFGVSKLVSGADGRDETATRDRLLTPSYASPEQLAGGLVTTASDVYSLGVVLYELLTGALPRPPGIAGSAAGEPRPSLAVALDPAAAEARSVTTAALRRQLAGDLDAIVLKALRDDAEERYLSVEQLAEDVRRFLAGLPVDATAPRLVYRVRKFVGRNVAAVAATAVAGVALVVLVLSTLVQSSRLAGERDRAQHERRRAEEVTRFLVRSFELADPNQSSSGALTAREVVERAARRVSAELAGQPDLEAEMLTTLGAVHRGVGLYDESVRLLERALDLRREQLGDEHSATGATLRALALSLGQTGDFASAEARAREALATHQGVDEEATVADLEALLFALWGQRRLDEAEEVGRQALAGAARIVDGDPLQLVEAQTNLAVVLETKGSFEEAERLYREALANLRRRYGEDHPILVVTTNNLAWLLQEMGDFAAAEQRQREALELARRVFGERHPEVAINLNNLGLLMQRKGDYAAAEALHRESLALRRANLGEEHPSVARSLNNLALVLTERGDRQSAAELYEQAVELFRRTLGEDHPEVANAAANLGSVLTQLGRFGEAEGYLREALDSRRRRLGNAHVDVGTGCVALAKLLLATARPREAEGLAEEALAIYAPRLAADHWRIAVARGVLGASLAAQGELAAAEPLLVEDLETLSAARGDGSSATQWQLQRLVDLYVSWGRHETAAKYRARLLP